MTGHAVSGGATATMMQVVKNTWMRHGLWKGFFPGVHVALVSPFQSERDRDRDRDRETGFSSYWLDY